MRGNGSSRARFGTPPAHTRRVRRDGRRESGTESKLDFSHDTTHRVVLKIKVEYTSIGIECLRRSKVVVESRGRHHGRQKERRIHRQHIGGDEWETSSREDARREHTTAGLAHHEQQQLPQLLFFDDRCARRRESRGRERINRRDEERKGAERAG